MRQHQQELDQLGIQVVVVTFERRELARAYGRETGSNWPILIDESRSLYAAYGMEQGSWWSILQPASWWIYLKLILRGRRLRRATGDLQQRGGDVLVDPRGIVRLHHVGRGPADRPAVDTLLTLVRRAEAAGTKWN